MRITCPLCGERGSEEFHYLGGVGPNRPAPDAPADVWHRYVYLRENPAGLLAEYWQHQHGCRSWLIVTRDTRMHEIQDVRLARSIEATA